MDSGADRAGKRRGKPGQARRPRYRYRYRPEFELNRHMLRCGFWKLRDERIFYPRSVCFELCGMQDPHNWDGMTVEVSGRGGEDRSARSCVLSQSILAPGEARRNSVVVVWKILVSGMSCCRGEVCCRGGWLGRRIGR